MSIKVMTWVWDQDLRSPDKFLLLAISDNACDDGGNAWPSVAELVRKTGMSRAGVQKSLRRLEAAGWISTTVQGGGTAKMPPFERPNLYRVHMGDRASLVGAPPPTADTRPRLPQHVPPPTVEAQTVLEPPREPKEAEPMAQQAIPDSEELPAGPEINQRFPTLNQRANLIARECLDRYPLNAFHGVRTTVGAALRAGIPDDTVRRVLRALCERNDPVSVNSLKVELNGGFRSAPRTYDDPGTRIHDTAAPPTASDVFVAPGSGESPNDLYRAAREAARRTA